MSFESSAPKADFLKALRGDNSSKQTPVWFMRQAGRYLPEYRKLREEYNFRQMSHTPELIAEVTLQPFQHLDLDAAILFSDILTCLEFMGAGFEFTEAGPKLANAGFDTLINLKKLDVENLSFVRQGIKKIKTRLVEKPLIGFVGAPFTLASYLIEGGTSREFEQTRRSLLEFPDQFSEALNFLADQISKYVVYQIESGVDAIQIFDSWVGICSQQVYRKHIQPSVAKIVKVAHEHNKPVILYSQPSSHLIELLAETGADMLSVDWRTPISQFARRLPRKIGFQGNLDPIYTTLNKEIAITATIEILEDIRANNLADRFVFNVGHGVTPQTQLQTLQSIVELCHARS
ncbi:MAG: uroporphyrinogen decarboxylase [Bdellovibrionales bacterium CG10_big_fil_rev_8_21_14_0_10_45_34]|nr:MAG: uroporphyrinogen decarboxylase [Bdellovibrionales bacterium CG10_big_fil_rev_8_21_14_0_10_45_34]